jgi:hypothetical protein
MKENKWDMKKRKKEENRRNSKEKEDNKHKKEDKDRKNKDLKKDNSITVQKRRMKADKGRQKKILGEKIIFKLDYNLENRDRMYRDKTKKFVMTYSFLKIHLLSFFLYSIFTSTYHILSYLHPPLLNSHSVTLFLGFIFQNFFFLFLVFLTSFYVPFSFIYLYSFSLTSPMFCLAFILLFKQLP